MADMTETPEDVDRALARAREALETFEAAVDSKRLMQRLRFSSPAHPVLLFRFLFGGLFFLCLAAAVVIMGVTTANDDIARTIAQFEAVLAIPLPEEIPVIPALLSLIALTMALAWVTATLAALSLGREAQMLPWERKEHQNLVNEITRLTTQRAVMERIRGTPAGARPRIATPVPLGPRVRPTTRTSATGGGGGFTRAATPSGTSAYALGRPPGPTSTARADRPPSAATGAAAAEPTPPAPAPAAGGFAPRQRGGALASRMKTAERPSGGAGPTAPRQSAPVVGFGRKPAPPPLELLPDPPSVPVNGPDLGPADDTEEDEETGGVRLGAPPSGRDAPAGAPSTTDPPQMTEAAFRDLLDEARPPGGAAPRAATPAGGILGRARAGVVGLRSTPFGSAGRVRPPPLSTPPAIPHAPDSAPRKPPKPRPRLVSRPPAAAPPGAQAVMPAKAQPAAAKAVRPAPSLEQAATLSVDDVHDEDELPTATARETELRRPPEWGLIEEEWLREAVTRAEGLVRSFPQQVYLTYSAEPHLPFTLVVARATPAVAVRSMVSFVAFLASIATPPRARIELIGVAHLDRTFHKNVEAALEPHFSGNVEVEPNPGRVDIRFNEPDPQWGAYPTLPIR